MKTNRHSHSSNKGSLGHLGIEVNVGLNHNFELLLTYRLEHTIAPIRPDDKYYTFDISLEMLSQLNHLALMTPTPDKSVAYERIKFAAKNIMSVNTNRFDFINGDHHLLHTTAIALGLYEQQHERASLLPFHKAPPVLQ
jgi:hypothetical protein